MIVYRIIRYECEPDNIKRLDETLSHSICGLFAVNRLRITAAPIERRIIEAVPMILHQLTEAEKTTWQPLPKPVLDRVSIGRVSSSTPNLRTRDDGSEAATFVHHINEMLDGGDYAWAEDTLLGIMDTVEKNGYVTDRQRQAVENIENASRRD